MWRYAGSGPTAGLKQGGDGGGDIGIGFKVGGRAVQQLTCRGGQSLNTIQSSCSPGILIQTKDTTCTERRQC